MNQHKQISLIILALLIGCVIGLFVLNKLIKSSAIQELRRSNSKNLTALPLKDAVGQNGWYFYKSRLSYSFSFPKNWVIKECQLSEDCEYHAATSIHLYNNQNFSEQAFLQISIFTPGTSECIHNLVSNGSQIDKQYLDVLRYGTDSFFAINMPIKHNDSCFEFLGNFTTNEEKETLLKILSTFRFEN